MTCSAPARKCFCCPASARSSRGRIWHLLASRLAQRFRTVAVDWPGFDCFAVPRLVQSPDVHLAFLGAFVDAVIGGRAAVLAADHAAGYVLLLARQRPGIWSTIVSVAPDLARAAANHDEWLPPAPRCCHSGAPHRPGSLSAERRQAGHRSHVSTPRLRGPEPYYAGVPGPENCCGQVAGPPVPSLVQQDLAWP
jgi:hypothetical protein